jgi:hypothetical protein
MSVHRIPRIKPTQSAMPIFSSSNGRFSFAPPLGNAKVIVGDVDIVVRAEVVGGGDVVVVGAKVVAGKDGDVVIGIVGDVAGADVAGTDVAGTDVAGAEADVGCVMPAGTVDVATGGVVVEGIGGKVRGGSVLHRLLNSELPNNGGCQFPRN